MTVDSPARSCPRCDALVTPEAKFCANCGQALEQASVDDAATHARLTAAAPGPLISKMRAARLTGERKPVTALFADVVGSTTLAESMDPEDWTVMINEAFDLMSRAVFRYEGTIAQLQGDAILAFFGAPVAHEDDPERAIFAALDMVEATQEFARRLQSTHGIDFQIRAGINTGPVMVGNVGSDLRFEYTALGDAVNVAARMQTAASPNTVLITDGTQRLTGDTFDVEDLGGIEVKGKAEPIHAYRVVGRKVAPARRRGLAAVGLDSPMVGRDEPLACLSAALDVVRAGRGRVAFVIGEPGIGKSRLLAELKAHAIGRESSATWIEGRCVSYGRNLPYHLLIDLVRSILGLSFAAEGGAARATLDRGVGELLGGDPAEVADTAPYLAHLLDLPLTRDEQGRIAVEPEVLQGRYVAATHRLMRGLAARGPVIAVCEDLHWADPASIDIVRQVMPLAARLPILFLGALRAETDAPGWALIGQARDVFGDSLVEVRLEPLSDADGRQLVSNLLEIELLPEHVRDLIMARSEGNPFFVEEVVRMLIERGVIVSEGDRWVATRDIGGVEIPESLHGLLLARIDQLPDAAKRSLRIAAVIGRQFPVRVLERVFGEGVTVSDIQLDTLEAKGLIKLAAVRPDLEYLFRHALVQDAAYGSLLKQERRELHGLVGDALEQLYPDRRDELAPVLAMHFEQAGDNDKAIDYFIAGGRHAIDANAIQEAFAAYDRAGVLASQMAAGPGPGADEAVARRRRVEIAVGRAQAGYSFLSMQESFDLLESVVDDAAAIGDPELEFRLHLLIALGRLQSGEPAENPQVKRSLDRIALLADAMHEPALASVPMALVGMSQVFAGPVLEGLAKLERAIPHLTGRNSIGEAFARGALAMGYAQIGEFAKADEAAAKAKEMAADGDLIAQLDALIAESMVKAAEGKLDSAIPIAQECVDRAEATGASACVLASSWVLGDAFHRQGKFVEARAILQRGADVALAVDRKIWRPTLVAWLGTTMTALGEVTDGDWDGPLAIARSIHNKVGEAGILGKRAESEAARGEHEAAIADFNTSAEIFQGQGMRPAQARVLRSLGAAYRAAGRTTDADTSLGQSLALFEELGLEAEAGAVRMALAVGDRTLAFD